MTRLLEWLAGKPAVGVTVLFFVVAFGVLMLCWSEASKE